MKKVIKRIINSFGYDIIKKYNSGHDNQDAFIYNEIENINKRNKDSISFNMLLHKDSKFINCIYNYITDIYAGEGNFLDVGCGTGVLVNKLIKEYIESDIQGCDVSENKIGHCKNYYDNDNFFIHNILDPLSKNYDFITCTEVLEHLTNPEKALNNLLDALNFHGKLFISVPDGRKDNFQGHIHFWSPESFKLFIEKELKKRNECYTCEFKILYGRNIVLIEKEFK
jgi:2-polyprenyl-3-methyl-5-hydroxy-6-metoxy-1,4-benzoquinol methylase